MNEKNRNNLVQEIVSFIIDSNSNCPRFNSNTSLLRIRRCPACTIPVCKFLEGGECVVLLCLQRINENSEGSTYFCVPFVARLAAGVVG